jgi:hypothetical protein
MLALLVMGFVQDLQHISLLAKDNLGIHFCLDITRGDEIPFVMSTLETLRNLWIVLQRFYYRKLWTGF